MPTYSTKALVLHKTKLADADLIFTLLAADGSQIRAVAKGVRKPKSKLRGTLELYSIVDLLCANGKSLDIICEAATVVSNQACREDLEHSSAAAVCCELLKKLSLEGQTQPRLFDMSVAALGCLGEVEQARIPLIVSAFVIKVLSLLGYRPILGACAICGSPLEQSNLLDGTKSDENTAFADGMVHFSLRDGGALCDECANERGEVIELPKIQLRWLQSLISSTFLHLQTCEFSRDLSFDLLDITKNWMQEHTQVTCRSFPVMYTMLEMS